MVDALGSGPSGSNPVRVRVSLRVEDGINFPIDSFSKYAIIKYQIFFINPHDFLCGTRGMNEMKIKFILVVCALYAVSVSAFAKKTPKDDFKVVYDDVSDSTRITHVNMELKSLYNLKDNISGERENIRLFISNGWLAMSADYQNNEWLFINSVVFLDGNGGRLKINNGNRKEDVKNFNTVFVRERYIAILEDVAAKQLYDILQAGKPTVTFVGSNYRTDKLDIKPKVKAAMIATIEKWRSLQEK